jgi:hypothetical protein
MRWNARSSFVWVMALAIAGGVVGATAAAAADSPILRFDSSSNVEIDLHRVVEDLTPLLVMPDLGDSAKAAHTAILDLLGVPSLDRLRYQTRSSLKEIEGHLTVTLDRSRPAGFLGALADVPPGRFTFGRYLRDGDAAVILSRPNAAGDLEALTTFANRPEIQDLLSRGSAQDLTFLTLWRSQIEPEILPLLSGELDVVVLPPRPDAESRKPAVIAVLGVRDASAFRDKLLDSMESMLGSDTVGQMRAVPGTKAGDFTVYPLMKDFVYGLGPGFFAVASDSARLVEIIGREASGQRGLPEVTGRTYVRVDADLLVPIMASAEGGTNESAAAMDSILAVVREASGGHLGVFEVTGTAGSDHFDLTFHGPGSLLSAEYALLQAGMKQGLMERATQMKTARLRQAVSTIDQAMTRYGKDHGGLYPEKLEQLVEEGYLEALPDLTPTPPGRYVEGGYTYIPLENADGWVDGYFYFVYGGGKDRGYDVFTPENVKDEAHFHVASDGRADGVPAFAYDGSAADQVEAWRQGR